MSKNNPRLVTMMLGAVIASITFAGLAGPSWASGKSKGLFPLGETTPVPRLSDKPLPFAKIQERPALPVELGCKFLGTGNLKKGIALPTGAVWTPCLWMFGTLRTAFQTYDSVGPEGRNTEFAARLDWFTNLQLTSTEKCIVGLSPLDKNRFTNFTRHSFESNQGLEDGQGELGIFVRAAFCEGDFGSLFPNLDPRGTNLIDYGFSFGRQQITFQEGIMVNDTLDSIGVVRNNLHAPGFSNIRITGLWAFDSIDRGTVGNRQRLNEGGFFGLFTQADTSASTFAVDLITIQDDDNDSTGGDGYYIGLSSIQRGFKPWPWGVSGEINTAYRINASISENDDTPQVTDGVLLSAEFSWTPHSSDDVVYMNPFVGINRYSQAGREPIVGGPLAALGISFASPSLGNHLSELSSFNTEVVGAAIGYQAFWDNHRRNLVLEIAAVKDNSRDLLKSKGDGNDAVAFSVQFQQAIGQRVQLQLDGFVSALEGGDNGTGARFEVLTQF